MSVAKGEATSGAAPAEIHAEERDEVSFFFLPHRIVDAETLCFHAFIRRSQGRHDGKDEEKD